jgi:hypothetical protein
LRLHFFFFKKKLPVLSQPVIPAFRRLRLEGLSFKASLDYIMKPCFKKQTKKAKDHGSKSVLDCRLVVIERPRIFPGSPGPRNPSGVHVRPSQGR